jgi:hypothetical protein
MKGGVKECDNRTLRSDEIDSVVLKEVLKHVFSRHNLEKYSKMIADSVIDEKKELEALVSRYRKEKEALAKKEAVYFDGLESGKLESSLVGERLKHLSDRAGAKISVHFPASSRCAAHQQPRRAGYQASGDFSKNMLWNPIRKRLENP